MKIVIDFLRELRENNNREWFEEHREQYEAALERFNDFAMELQAAVAKFDPTVAGLSIDNMTYRIYRDMRFRPNEEPHKNHFGVYIARGGKKAGYGGYYFHVEPSGGSFFNRSIIAAGLFRPTPKTLLSVREEILDNGAAFVEAMECAEGFELKRSDTLIRMPRGFEEGSGYDDLLKLKRFFMTQSIDDSFILAPNLVERVAAEFNKGREFVEIINRAVQFAHEEYAD